MLVSEMPSGRKSASEWSAEVVTSTTALKYIEELKQLQESKTLGDHVRHLVKCYWPPVDCSR